MSKKPFADILAQFVAEDTNPAACAPQPPPVDPKAEPRDIQRAIRAATAQATEAHANEELAEAGIVFQDWRGFMAKEPPAWDWIISDVIAKSMKGDLNAKSKQWKSFFGMQLALCVATGRPFLNMQVPRARRAAYCNLEIIERGAWERGTAMSTAMDATPEEGMLYVVNLRGNAGKLREHTPALVAEVRRLGIDLLVLDPRYKLVAEGEDENSAAGLRGVLNFRDALAEAAAVLMIGHDPKGDTAGKSMADRGAGSYTAGADYDFSFALSPHVEDGYSVLSTSCRYRKSPHDLTIRFDDDRQVFDGEPDKPAIVKDSRRVDGGRLTNPTDKANARKLKGDALKNAVATFAEGHIPIDREEYATKYRLESKTTFLNAIARMKEGQDFSVNDRREEVKSLIAQGVIAETPQLVRKPDGTVKQTKERKMLVGTPGNVNAYVDSFNRLPL